MYQTTIREPFIIPGGIGLHTGKKTPLYFHPAPANHGIVFYRADKDIKIPADYKYVQASSLCTSLEKNGVRVSTVEHLLSVCNGAGIDNLLVEIHNEEIPIFDGSGIEYFEKFKAVGLKELDKPKKIIVITKAVTWTKGDITIYVAPAPGTTLTFSIDFDHKQLGKQEVLFKLNESNYAGQIVRAKTFCMERDIPKMKELGLIKGGNKKNAIILSDDGNFSNMEVMTWLNEPNLHKILDQIGDLFLAKNMRIQGNIFSHKSGHSSHIEFLRYLLDECPDSYEVREIS